MFLSYRCVRVAETLSRLCADKYNVLDFVTSIKISWARFFVFIESASRDASNERINSLYFL